MKTPGHLRRLGPRARAGAAIQLVLALLALSSAAQSLQLASSPDPQQTPSASAGGDSCLAAVTPDGRYVLFASIADNLVLATNNSQVGNGVPRRFNVYVRDRASNTTALASVNLTGISVGDASSFPLGLSTNGQFVLFESDASDLVAGDTNNARDIFVRDLVGGTTTLVSVSTNGSVADGASRSAALTPDGRYVAFVSEADNLVPEDTNGIADVFVRDLGAGTTVLASVGAVASSSNPSQSGSAAPGITPDGRYVVFSSTATNLAPAAPSGGDIYVRDMVAGATTWASSGARAALHNTNAVCYNGSLSDDGQFVAFETSYPRAYSSGVYSGVILRYNLATGLTDLVHSNALAVNDGSEFVHNLDMSPDGRFIAFVALTNGMCIRLWDANTGSSTLISGSASNTVPAGSACGSPGVDSTGRFVSFLANATGLTTNVTTGGWHAYLRDTAAGTTTLLDATTNSLGSSANPIGLSAPVQNGRLVAFDCSDNSLVASDDNHSSDVFLRDVVAGTTELISVRHDALPSAPNGASTLSSGSVSSDGRWVAFASDADNLAPNDTNGYRDVFLRDLAAGTSTLISVATNGFSGNRPSQEPALSADGRYVAFSSYANNLVPGDANAKRDVFVRDMQSGATSLISVNTAGTASGNDESYAPQMGADGRFILFRSKASNLAPGGFSGENLFLRDAQAGATYALTTAGVSSVAMTRDGRWVAFVDTAGASAGNVCLWDSLAAAFVFTISTVSVITNVDISSDGNRVASCGGSGTFSVRVWDRLANSSRQVFSGGAVPAHPVLRLGGGGQCLVFTANTNQLYCYDFSSDSTVLVSSSYRTSALANGASDSADISADGRFIAYHSTADDLVPGDTNGLSDIFLYDRQAGSNILLTVSRAGSSGANSLSFTPVFSGDGRTLVFASMASDLVANDFGQQSDIFAYSFFYALILPGATPGEGVWLSWPYTPGKTYRVQFKNRLDDPIWQDLGGSITNRGYRAELRDPSPDATHRFYRVMSF